MNLKKHLILFLILLIVVTFISTICESHPINTECINTIYTVSGIMFSIGMSVICSMNLSSIKNPSIYNTIRENINGVRNTYLLYFGVVTGMYLILQIIPKTKYKWPVFSFSVSLDFSYLCITFNLLSILYFIVNFIEIQKLHFEIVDKRN